MAAPPILTLVAPVPPRVGLLRAGWHPYPRPPQQRLVEAV